MIDYIAEVLSGKLVGGMDYDDNSRLWIKYSVEVLISSLITCFIIILGAVLCNKIIFAALYLLLLIPIRKYMGGYHAKTHLKCILLTSGLFYFALILANLLESIVNIYIIFAETIIGILIITLFCPVKNENKYLSANERKKYKLIALIVLLLENIVCYVFNKLNYKYGNFCFIIIVSVFIFTILEIAKGGRLYGKKDTC